MAVTAYPITFTTSWTYNASGGYQTLGRFTNNESFRVCIRKVGLYVGTGVGTFTDGDYVYGNGSTIKSWVGFFDNNDTLIRYFPPDGGGSSTTDGVSITKQVGTLSSANGTYPNPSACAWYEYNNLNTNNKPVDLIVDPGKTVTIKITGGYFTPNGSGVLCIDKYGINGSTRQSYIYVEPYQATVTFDGNGGIANPASKSATPNTSIILANATRTGYSFTDEDTPHTTGWFTARNGTDDRVGGAGDTYKVTKNITLYAHWKINQYTLSFDANGGETGIPSSQTEYYNTAVTIPATIPVWNHHFFSTWNTMSDGSGQSYSPGQTFNLTDNITLYAQWIQNNSTLLHQYDDTTDTWNPVQNPHHTPVYVYDETESTWKQELPIYIYSGGQWNEV